MAARIVKEELTAEYLRELLSYNPETGEFVWRVSCRGTKAGDIAGTSGSQGRRHIIIGYARYKAHRLAWLYIYGKWPDKLIDHINGDPTDNRISNLREASVSENQGNQRSAHRHNKTGLLGSHQKHGRTNFRARITVGGKEIHLGHFPTAELAHKAYLAAKSKYHVLGEVAKGAEQAPKKSERSDTSASGVPGVRREKRAKSTDKWSARIKIDGVEIALGLFDQLARQTPSFRAGKDSASAGADSMSA